MISSNAMWPDGTQVLLLNFGGAWNGGLRVADQSVYKILQTKRIPDAWSTLVPIYKNKGDI